MIRGFKIARGSPDNFGKLLAIGITSWISFQAFVNIAAMVGLLPLTGIPLPFISYGGTALTILLLASGILVNISKQTKN
jgi:cell division protein FtsW